METREERTELRPLEDHELDLIGGGGWNEGAAFGAVMSGLWLGPMGIAASVTYTAISQLK